MEDVNVLFHSSGICDLATKQATRLQRGGRIMVLVLVLMHCMTHPSLFFEKRDQGWKKTANRGWVDIEVELEKRR